MATMTVDTIAEHKSWMVDYDLVETGRSDGPTGVTVIVQAIHEGDNRPGFLIDQGLADKTVLGVCVLPGDESWDIVGQAPGDDEDALDRLGRQVIARWLIRTRRV